MELWIGRCRLGLWGFSETPTREKQYRKKKTKKEYKHQVGVQDVDYTEQNW